MQTELNFEQGLKVRREIDVFSSYVSVFTRYITTVILSEAASLAADYSLIYCTVITLICISDIAISQWENRFCALLHMFSSRVSATVELSVFVTNTYNSVPLIDVNIGEIGPTELLSNSSALTRSVNSSMNQLFFVSFIISFRGNWSGFVRTALLIILLSPKKHSINLILGNLPTIY
jgi:hypothetical protein